MTHAKILIVEDDAPSAAHLEECLENLGYTVCAAVSCGHEAIEKAEHKCPDLALVNLGLDGEVSGLETAEQIGSRFDVPVVYLTDGAEEDLLQRAQATNPFGYVVKPFEERQLHLNIQTAVSMHERETRHRKTEMRLKRIIKKLKDFTRLMKPVFDSMSEGVVAVNENGELVFHNSVARGFGEGLPAEQDIDKWAEKYGVFQPDGKALVSKDESPLTLALNGKATDDFEVMVHNEEMPEGVHAHISISGRPLRGKAGALKGGVLVFRDITKLQHTEVELERTIAEQKDQALLMETILSSISDGVLVANAEGKFTFFNPSAEQITGSILDLKSEQWAGNYGVFYSDQKTRMPTAQLPLVCAVRGEETDEIEMFLRNKKKLEGVFISVSGRPLRTNVGGHGGGVIIFRDVTERMLAEEALAQAFAQGRLEVMDTILHNIGNAINSVTTGIETVRQNLGNDRVGRRLFALATAVREHQDDWSDYIENDPQGRKVMPFIIELSESFSKRNEDLMKTVGRVRDRANHIADIVRTQKAFGSPTMARKDIDLHEALSAAARKSVAWSCTGTCPRRSRPSR